MTETPLRPLLCVVSVGEVYKLARQWKWGKTKHEALYALLRNLVIVDIRPQSVLDAYAEIAWYSEQQRGRTIPQNDYWIAAVAKVTGATLLTTDRDFDHLEGAHIRREWIDPTQRSP